MIKIILFIVFFLFSLNFFPKKIMQFICQFMILFIFFYFIIFKIGFNIIWSGIYYFIGGDIYSLILILLTLWIIGLIFMSRNKFLFWKNFNLYIILILGILLIIIICFFTFNFIIFYILFESSLIPIFILIMGWGYQIERIQAGIYIIIYTLFGSIPLFLILLNLYILENSLIIDIIFFNYNNLFIYLSIIIAFLVKIPIYFVHLWLPKAHVEAPVIGSIILAGVILKLGRYGLIRVILIIMNLCINYNKFIIIIRLIGRIYRRLICLCQIDIKILVAYSSIVHIGLLISSIITMYNWGYLGSYLIIIAHGLCSSGLFYLVNVNYERLRSRSLLINKGLINLLPSLTLIWFLLLSSNLSFPPSLNLFREIILFNSLIIWNNKLIYLLILISFFRASYSLYLFSFRQHGKINLLIYSLINIKLIDYFILLIHWVPLNLLFLILKIFYLNSLIKNIDLWGQGYKLILF